MTFKIEISHWTQTIEMKQNQKFFHGTYWNLTSIFIVHKILKRLHDFYNWYPSISLEIKKQTSKVR